MAGYDAIVLGVGGVGSAALYHLARRGARVLGIDRFAPGHDRGSSHGETRIIRQAYFEHTDYVPLLRRAFELWDDLQQRVHDTLYHPSGLLQIGPPGGEVIHGVRASARQHGLEIENLSAREVHSRFGGFRMPEGSEAVFERHAGYLMVERCVQAHAEEALHLGAELHTEEVIRGWRMEGELAIVETDRTTYSADRLVVAAGAWSGQLLADLGIPLQVRRKPLYWWQTRGDTYRADRGCPCYLYQLPRGVFYGVPQTGPRGIKAGEHTGGVIVQEALAVNREVDLADQQHVAEFVSEFLNDATTECTDHTVCLYTMSPDANFIVDRHPAHAAVAFAAGLSGHGFKFTGVLGQILSDLAIDGRTDLPIDFLSATRPGLRV